MQQVTGRAARLAFVQWRDISLGSTRTIEIVWTDGDGKRRLSIADWEHGTAPLVLVGPPIDDITTLIVAGDLRRDDYGLPCLHRDQDGPSDELRAALVEMHKAVA